MIVAQWHSDICIAVVVLWKPKICIKYLYRRAHAVELKYLQNVLMFEVVVIPRTILNNFSLSLSLSLSCMVFKTISSHGKIKLVMWSHQYGSNFPGSYLVWWFLAFIQFIPLATLQNYGWLYSYYCCKDWDTWNHGCISTCTCTCMWQDRKIKENW